MHPYSVKVWYFCKECTISFQNLEDFFEHKNRIHFSELQNTKCIVFEERIKSEDHQHVSSPANYTQDFEPQLNEGQVVCGLQDSLIINDTDLHFDGNTEDSFQCELSENIDNETVSQNFQSSYMHGLGTFYNVNVNTDVKPAIFSSKDTSNEETTKTTTTEENIDPLSFDFQLQPQAQLTIYEKIIKVENESQNISVGMDRRVKALQNPYIRLTRLTSKEIEQYKQSSIQPNLKDCSAYFENGAEIQLPATSSNSCKCQLCSKKLNSEPELKIHMGICSLYHKDRHRFCVPCNRKFVKAQSLQKHCVIFHGTNQLPFNSQLSSRMPHQVNGLKSKNYRHKCDQCSYSTWRGDMLTSHKRYRHSNSRPFKCSLPNCGLAFKTRTNLGRHVSLHSENRAFPCTYPNCNRGFKRKAYLLDHEFRVHSISTSLTSELVGQSNHSLPLPFNSQLVSINENVAVQVSSAMQHRVDGTAFENKSNEVYNCDQCTYFSSHKNRVASHKANKHSNNKWLCSQPNCGQIFKTRDDLRAHRTLHWDETPFHCSHPNCDRVFKRVSSLVHHEAEHSNPLPFTCTLPNCEQSFKLRHQLKNHLRAFHFVEPESIVTAKSRFILP